MSALILLLAAVPAELAKGGEKAPPGYEPIPGGAQGGYRIKKGAGYDYWYPHHGARLAAADHHEKLARHHAGKWHAANERMRDASPWKETKTEDDRDEAMHHAMQKMDHEHVAESARNNSATSDPHKGGAVHVAEGSSGSFHPGASVSFSLGGKVVHGKIEKRHTAGIGGHDEWLVHTPEHGLMSVQGSSLRMALAKTVDLKPPPGYEPIPGGAQGGYRIRHGLGWNYWYPTNKARLGAEVHHAKLMRHAPFSSKEYHEHEDAAKAANADKKKRAAPDQYYGGAVYVGKDHPPEGISAPHNVHGSQAMEAAHKLGHKRAAEIVGPGGLRTNAGTSAAKLTHLVEESKKLDEAGKTVSTKEAMAAAGKLGHELVFEIMGNHSFSTTTPAMRARLVHEASKSLAKGAASPPSGYLPIPGGAQGGYRIKKGTGYDYWYPNHAARTAAAEDHEAMAVHHRHQATVAAGGAAAKGHTKQADAHAQIATAARNNDAVGGSAIGGAVHVGKDQPIQRGDAPVTPSQAQAAAMKLGSTRTARIIPHGGLSGASPETLRRLVSAADAL